MSSQARICSVRGFNRCSGSLLATAVPGRPMCCRITWSFPSSGHGVSCPIPSFSAKRTIRRAVFRSEPVDPCYSSNLLALSGQVKSGQRWSGQNRPTDVAQDLILLTQLLWIRQAGFRSPASWSAFQDVTVVAQPVEHGGDGGAVTEQLAPVFHRTVSKQCAGTFVTTHHDFEQFLCRRAR